MTQEEALRLLAQVVAQTRALPQEHQMLQEALRTLAKKEEQKEPVKE